MSNATDDQRAKASRIRKKGERATQSERQWLRAYDKAKEARARKREAETPRAEEPTVTSAPAPEEVAPPGGEQTQHEDGLVEPDFPPEPAEPDDDWAKFDAEVDATVAEGNEAARGGSAQPIPLLPADLAHGSTSPAPTCGDPQCPACSSRVGGKVCNATGKIVWDPIDEETARGTAMMILAGIGWAISLLRPDKRVIQPSDAEIRLLGEGLRKAAYRRMNALGAYDDLLMLLAGLTMYGRRAFAEDNQDGK